MTSVLVGQDDPSTGNILYLTADGILTGNIEEAGWFRLEGDNDAVCTKNNGSPSIFLPFSPVSDDGISDTSEWKVHRSQDISSSRRDGWNLWELRSQPDERTLSSYHLTHPQDERIVIRSQTRQEEEESPTCSLGETVSRLSRGTKTITVGSIDSQEKQESFRFMLFSPDGEPIELKTEHFQFSAEKGSLSQLSHFVEDSIWSHLSSFKGRDLLSSSAEGQRRLYIFLMVIFALALAGLYMYGSQRP